MTTVESATYAELVEYIRIAVQLDFLLSCIRTAAADGGPTIH